MKRYTISLCFAVSALSIALLSFAGTKNENRIKSMSKEELIKLALSAAPVQISKDATIMVSGEDGKLMEVKKGTNGFTCLPDLSGLPEPDPICADPASWQWVSDLSSGAPKPTNSIPGISYMAKGGWHFEKDGKILNKKEPGAKAVEEPPHWMVFWPFDKKTVKLPTLPNNGGTYIMWEDTPYAHLMIYQDPNKMF
ncbi:MAG TPA: hypothetical protein VGB26_09785 [Nitrospiria bacterium]